REPAGLPDGRAAAGGATREARARTVARCAQNCAAQISGAPADHGFQPCLLHRSAPTARSTAADPRTCARARRGIHSRAGPVPVTLNSLRSEIRWAVEAAEDKQAVDITVLKLAGTGAFAEYFLLCSGQSHPQIQAIAD